MSRADRFLCACRRERTDRTPVWFMRQAGRYLPEYAAIKEKHSFLELARTPELAAQVTLQPIDRLGVDAAILFSDILIVLPPMGVEVGYRDGGPALSHRLSEERDVRRLRPLHPAESLPFVAESIALVRRELAGKVPLIGFAGAPFTLASYLCEGGHSRSFARTKRMMYGAPAAWHALMDLLAEAVARHLAFQAEAGAQALQLFDSWVGVLSPEDYDRFVAPYSRRAIAAARAAGVPVIHFGTETGALLERMRDAGGDVIGVDWRVPIDEARARLGPGVAVQGNLDPCVLLGPPDEACRRARDIVRRAGAPGFVFNLGHGILPETPPDTARAVVEAVHEEPVPMAREAQS